MSHKSASERQRDFEQISAKNAEVRRQFVTTELQTCETTIQVGEVELAAGNMPTVEKEIETVMKGMGVIERFLPGVQPEYRDELQRRLEAVRAALDRLTTSAAARRVR